MQIALVQAFRDQAKACLCMGSPLTSQVCDILARRLDLASPLGQALAKFSGDIGPAGHSLPLRVAAGLHALVLCGRDTRLKAAYPPHAPALAELEAAVTNALKTHEDFLLDWVKIPPQTNEVRRSAALIAMARVAYAQFDRPAHLFELGASGGLNLMWDHYALVVDGKRFGSETAVVTFVPEWSGPCPPAVTPRIVHRSGVDLNPLHPGDETGLIRLLAYVWADQAKRLSLTRATASVADGSVEQADAIDALEMRLANRPDGHMLIVQNTVAWQYFCPDGQARGRALMSAAGARATRDTPLAWMQMEADATGDPGAALTLRLWPGDLVFQLGRADFHGRWVHWTGMPDAADVGDKNE